MANNAAAIILPIPAHNTVAATYRSCPALLCGGAGTGPLACSPSPFPAVDQRRRPSVGRCASWWMSCPARRPRAGSAWTARSSGTSWREEGPGLARLHSGAWAVRDHAAGLGQGLDVPNGSWVARGEGRARRADDGIAEAAAGPKTRRPKADYTVSDVEPLRRSRRIARNASAGPRSAMLAGSGIARIAPNNPLVSPLRPSEK